MTLQEDIQALLMAERDYYKHFADKFAEAAVEAITRPANPTPIVIGDEVLHSRIKQLEEQIQKLTEVPVGSVWTWVATGDRVIVKSVIGDRITTRPEERAISDYFWDRDAFLGHHRLESA